MGFFDKFRQPKRPRPHNSPTPLQPSTPPPEETWPWPDIDRPAVQSLQQRAAFHEAGHAVVARYFAREIFVMNADGTNTYSTGQQGFNPRFGG